MSALMRSILVGHRPCRRLSLRKPILGVPLFNQAANLHLPSRAFSVTEMRMNGQGNSGSFDDGDHSDDEPPEVPSTGTGSGLSPQAAMAAALMSGASLGFLPNGKASTEAREVPVTTSKRPTVEDGLSTSDSKDSGKRDPVKETQLQLVSGGFMIPHPAKVAKGGEDAYFIDRVGRSFGIADGVGGWAESGVDAGEFARALMREARKSAEVDLPSEHLEPTSILERAFERSAHIIGSSTACIVCLNGTHIDASNIGDSGFQVIRNGEIIFESPPQQHRFNFPFQVGRGGDPVSACQVFNIAVKPGDVLIAGSDGLMDNVFNSKSAKIVWEAKKHGAPPGVAAQKLATFAAQRSRDPMYLSPFAKSAREAGFLYRGGKVDDITVLVSYVTEPANLAVESVAAKL